MACPLLVLNKIKKCCFCGRKMNNHFKYGPLYQLENIVAHYYCVLLSHKLKQNGADNEGILGFLLTDIELELKRTSKIKCVYCGMKRATLKCSSSKCKITFHLPCGLEHGSLHQFMDQFKSFCPQHKPVQNIPKKILKEAESDKLFCCVCYETVNCNNLTETLWAPCCSKTWYHRTCVQKLAHSAGYFFKCAICSNTEKFKKWMLRFGIFIPEQDASWETVPNAYQELLFRYNRCDAFDCMCPGGRLQDLENTRWEIILCNLCGSQGMHIACGNLKFMEPEWECSTCEKVSQNLTVKSLEKPTEINKESFETKCMTNAEGCAHVVQGSSKELIKSSEFEKNIRKRKRISEDTENTVLDKRKRVDGPNSYDTDEIIDVEGLESESNSKEKSCKKLDVQEVFSMLKPGPLRYKLNAIHNIFGNISRLKALNKEDEKKSNDDKIVYISSDSEVEVTDSENSVDEDYFLNRNNLVNQNTSWYKKVKKEVIEISDEDSLESSDISVKKLVPDYKNQIIDSSDEFEEPTSVVSKTESIFTPKDCVCDVEIISDTCSGYLRKIDDEKKTVAQVTNSIFEPEILISDAFSNKSTFIRSSDYYFSTNIRKDSFNNSSRSTKPIATVKPQCATQGNIILNDFSEDMNTEKKDDIIVIDSDDEIIETFCKIK